MNISDFIFGLTVWVIIKWFLVVGLLMYLAFAAVIIRQVGVMSESIQDPLNPLIKLFAWTHLVLTIILIVIVWGVL